jgi:hypothetical protein
MDFPIEILNIVLFEVVKICELLIAGACEASYIFSRRIWKTNTFQIFSSWQKARNAGIA